LPANSFKKTTQIAKEIANRIRVNLAAAKSLTLIVDEWANKRNIKYLGLSVPTLIANEYRSFTLGLVNIPEIVIDHEVILKYSKQILDEYQISRKISAIISDSASVMKSAYQDFDSALGSCIWHPCICHQINLIVELIITKSDFFLNPIKEFQAHVSKSPKFTSFCIANNATVSSIPSFSPTRWFSIIMQSVSPRMDSSGKNLSLCFSLSLCV
jgi:hypothetical protein